MATNRNNRYHPMIILMYHSNMLSPEQIQHIPRRTRNNWNQFAHENYFGYEMAKDYIDDFDYMKDVLTSKYLKRGMKLMCTVSHGYRDIMSKIENNKKLFREHRDKMTYSIERFARNANVKVNDACKILGVSRDWYYRHRNKKSCSKSILNKCFKQHPNQLTDKEVSKIEDIVTNPDNFGKPKTTLYFDSIRKGLIVCGLSTFFKYANLLGYKPKQKKEKEERPEGFRATRPFEWLHVDITHVQTQKDGIQYVAFVKDNFSRTLLGFKSTSVRPDSGFIRELFDEVFLKYNLFDKSEPINILSDGGSENKGELINWVNGIQAPPMVRKLTAKTDEFPYSNSMSESTHSIYKTEFLKKKHSYDIAQHSKHLEEFIDYYNHSRFPFEFFGLNPIEVLYGDKPDKTKFRKIIQQRKKERVEDNRQFNECPLVCV